MELHYFHLYFYHYPNESECYWHFGFKQGISRLAEVEKDYDKVIISSFMGKILILAGRNDFGTIFKIKLEELKI